MSIINWIIIIIVFLVASHEVPEEKAWIVLVIYAIVIAIDCWITRIYDH